MTYWRRMPSVLLLLLCLTSWAEAGAPVFENQDSTTAIAASVISMAGVTVSSSANRVLLAAFLFDSTLTVSNANWNGTAMTFVTAQNTGGAGFERLEIWRLIAPASASPGTVTANLSGSSNTTWGTAVVYKDADQTTPLGTPVNTSGNDAAPTTTVSSATGETVLGVFGIIINTGLANTGGQTNRSLATQTSTDLRMDDATGAASVTESYSTTAGFRWVSIGVAIKPVGGTSTPIRHKSTMQ